MTDVLRPVCPCGTPAPEPLPAPGHVPAPCGVCATPLVAPGRVGPPTLEAGIAAGVVAAVAAAFLWMLAAQRLDSGAHFLIPVGAFVVAWAVRLGARARSPGLQWSALLSVVVFVAVGEVLLYRHALLGRLVAMHAAENATDPDALGADELRAMTFAKYLHIELDLAWWGAVALATAVAWRVLRAVPAVSAFVPPATIAAVAPCVVPTADVTTGDAPAVADAPPS